MPSYLDFDSTKRFRDFILGKTLTAPNGPQTYNKATYSVQNLNDFPDKDLGDVTNNQTETLTRTQNTNIFKPIEYLVKDTLEVLPRRANLNLYPYFQTGQDHNIIGIMNTSNYDTESELFKFAANNMKNNTEGPIFGRISQNLFAATVGRVRIIDALQGNTSTALNLLTGREPLVEHNNKITVAKTLPGKGIDFLQTVSGVEFPFSEIPGNYLSNPRNPINVRPTAETELGKIYQDVTGALGSLIGIQRRPQLDRKPSDLFIEYLGDGQKQRLFDNLSYSKYAPNYTTTAMSQNSSKVFNFIDDVAQGVKNVLGVEAPAGIAYIGDDRSNDVKFAMGDFNDRPVRSPYYLSLMFDPIAVRVFQNTKNIGDGGSPSGKLTWISSKSKNKPQHSSQFDDSLSTNFIFRDSSILGVTQEILETLPTDGGQSRTHIANVIDQTSRVFREGDTVMSRGSAIKYIDKFTGTESGVEYCRVWTKDSPFIKNSDLMKRTGLIRKYNSSVLTTPYNLNIYPNSNGNDSFDGSTNIVKGKGDGFYAKKYMFSIENLAWKSSNLPGFTFNDLPYCERGNNGGRVMWFPPYDLKVTEQSNARWEENNFLGRPEPVYTYQNTSRSGQVSFKVIVDHPSILNLLVKKHFNNMSDEEADNYINAVFAGCEDLDFYALVRKYTTLDQSDIAKVISYLEAGKDTQAINRYKTQIEPVKGENLPETPTVTGDNGQSNSEGTTITHMLNFKNDFPRIGKSELYSDSDYESLYTDYLNSKPDYLNTLTTGLNKLNTSPNVNDINVIYGVKTLPVDYLSLTTAEINKAFSGLTNNFTNLDNSLNELKTKLEEQQIDSIRISLVSSTSVIADDFYNLKLSYRRSDSVIKYILNKLKFNNSITIPNYSWDNVNISSTDTVKDQRLSPIPFVDLGYSYATGSITFEIVKNKGEQITFDVSDNVNVDCHKKNIITKELRSTAPITFYCRQSSVGITYVTKSPDPSLNPQVITVNGVSNGTGPVVNPYLPKVNLIQNTETYKGKKTPPLDELKRIVMKVLSECYYFKTMEEDTPIVFNSLKEKLKYFHPSFHSMTPEGLNARLTFLQQCVRPGDTLPIKGISSESDLNARNTTFGAPPVSILRIGDFYHSKIIIRDVNISFDDSPWDLNPEGIGIQPMIATVQLQVSFLGGHGMEKPVEKLQNALSSNFYANTEVYDFRATATEDRSAFNKSELEKLVVSLPPTSLPRGYTAPTIITNGQFVGVLGNSGTSLDYTNLINNVYSSTSNYFDTYKQSLKTISSTYGNTITELFFSKKYRTVYNYEIEGYPYDLELIGEYPSNYNLSVLSDNFKETIDIKIKNTSIGTLIGLNIDLSPYLLQKSEDLINPYIRKTVGDIVLDFVNNPAIKAVEKSRINLASNLDKLNYIAQYSHDGQISGETASQANLSGFTASAFVDNYLLCLDYFYSNHSLFTTGFTGSYDFADFNLSITDNYLKEFLSIFLKDKLEEIMKQYEKDKEFTSKDLKSIRKRFAAFLVTPTGINPTLPKYPIISNSNPISFTINLPLVTITDTSEIDNLKKLFSSKVKLGTTLNYYKNG